MAEFEDKAEIEKERDMLIEELQKHDISDSEMRFILRKINHITEKLLEKVTK